MAHAAEGVRATRQNHNPCPPSAAWRSTRLDFINRPQATHRYEHRGGHGPRPPQPKQTTGFTTPHAHNKASISSAAEA
eukprot:3390450-Prymnesium_polylepis.1